MKQDIRQWLTGHAENWTDYGRRQPSLSDRQWQALEGAHARGFLYDTEPAIGEFEPGRDIGPTAFTDCWPPTPWGSELQ